MRCGALQSASEQKGPQLTQHSPGTELTAQTGAIAPLPHKSQLTHTYTHTERKDVETVPNPIHTATKTTPYSYKLIGGAELVTSPIRGDVYPHKKERNTYRESPSRTVRGREVAGKNIY